MSKNVLRDKMNRYLKAKLRDIARSTRDEKHLTQQKMVDRYAMNGDSFRAIEAGEYECSTLTAFLLLKDQEPEERNRIFDEIGAELEKIREEEYVTV